jgi:hypothetical protein
MQRILASAIALIGLVTLVPAASAESTCSLATLTGNYAGSQTGFESPNSRAPLLPFAVVGTLTFDGAGNVLTNVTDQGRAADLKRSIYRSSCRVQGPIQ